MVNLIEAAKVIEHEIRTYEAIKVIHEAMETMINAQDDLDKINSDKRKITEEITKWTLVRDGLIKEKEKLFADCQALEKEYGKAVKAKDAMEKTLKDTREALQFVLAGTGK